MNKSISCVSRKLAYDSYCGNTFCRTRLPIFGWFELMKIATILDQAHGAFGLEYDNTIGKKHTMRLEALTYERAVVEARSFLGINDDNLDTDGTLWQVE